MRYHACFLKKFTSLATFPVETPLDLQNPDPHDHSFDENVVNTHTEGPKFQVLDANYAYVHTKPE